MLNSVIFSIHGNDHGSGFAGYTEHFLSAFEKIVTNGPEAFLHSVLPGLAAMPNIHPLIVHFPIAFISAFFFLDLFGTIFGSEKLRSSASTLLYLGVIGAIGAVAAGLQAAKTIPHGETIHLIMEKHEHLGLTVTSLTILLAVWRIISKETPKGLGNFLHLSIAAVILVIMTMGVDLGGLMVYRYGVGVGNANIPNAHQSEMNHNHDHDHHH